ncbi:MAG: hypothetical protein K0Q49_1579 [Haloplasmataceae bacterium]|jgi:uncharacterized membrane protein YbaN (DUF454 family)|nr:hypothetical protein [Haloplasmataceae bacterium]
MKSILKIMLIIIGTIFLVIGLIGIIVPVMPTTPFLIVAGICYINSSQKLYQKVINIKYFGVHVQNYVERREITKQFKISTLLFIWIPSFITLVFIVDNLTVRIISISMSLLVTIHILTLKTIK